MVTVPVAPGTGSMVGRVTLSGHAVHIIDAANDPEYTWTKAQQGGRYRTMLGVPLLREGQTLGVISVVPCRRGSIYRGADRAYAVIR